MTRSRIQRGNAAQARAENQLMKSGNTSLLPRRKPDQPRRATTSAVALGNMLKSLVSFAPESSRNGVFTGPGQSSVISTPVPRISAHQASDNDRRAALLA